MDEQFYRLHDAVYEATGNSYDTEHLIEIIKGLPLNILDKINEYGLTDTEVCDMIYNHLKG